MTRALTKQNLALATAALGVGIGYGGAASAATISTVPAGFKPVALSEDDSTSYSFDVSGTGQGTVDVSGKTPKAGNSDPKAGPITTQKPGKIKLDSTAYEFYNGADNKLLASTDASLPVGGSFGFKSLLSNDGKSNFGSTSAYGFLRAAGAGPAQALAATDPQLFYIQGTFADRTFTLSDYGRIVADTTPAVPEPASWAMLTMGVGGVGAALRRSRRAERRRAALA